MSAKVASKSLRKRRMISWPLEMFWSLEKPAQDAFDLRLVEENQGHCFQ